MRGRSTGLRSGQLLLVVGVLVAALLIPTAASAGSGSAGKTDQVYGGWVTARARVYWQTKTCSVLGSPKTFYRITSWDAKFWRNTYSAVRSISIKFNTQAGEIAGLECPDDATQSAYKKTVTGVNVGWKSGMESYLYSYNSPSSFPWMGTGSFASENAQVAFTLYDGVINAGTWCLFVPVSGFPDQNSCGV